MNKQRQKQSPKATPKTLNIIPNSVTLELEALKPRIQDYRRLMEKVSLRIGKLRELIHNAQIHKQELDIELIALNFRKMAELIIYANLAGHSDEYNAAFPPENRDWNIKLLIDRLKLINTHYYPVPVVVTLEYFEKELRNRVKKYQGEFMTEEKLINMFNSCGKLLHADKATESEASPIDWLPIFIEWNNRLVQLIKTHTVFLTDTRFMILCHISRSGIQAVLYKAPVYGVFV